MKTYINKRRVREGYSLKFLAKQGILRNRPYLGGEQRGLRTEFLMLEGRKRRRTRLAPWPWREKLLKGIERKGAPHLHFSSSTG